MDADTLLDIQQTVADMYKSIQILKSIRFTTFWIQLSWIFMAMELEKSWIGIQSAP